MNEPRGPAGLPEIRQAYEFTLDRLGQDSACGGIWQDYVAFLQVRPRPLLPLLCVCGAICAACVAPRHAAPAARQCSRSAAPAEPASWSSVCCPPPQAPRLGSPEYTALFGEALEGQEESQKVAAVRRAYQRALLVPLPQAEALWRAYEGFEMGGANKQLARRLLDEWRPKYQAGGRQEAGCQLCPAPASALVLPRRCCWGPRGRSPSPSCRQPPARSIPPLEPPPAAARPPLPQRAGCCASGRAA